MNLKLSEEDSQDFHEMLKQHPNKQLVIVMHLWRDENRLALELYEDLLQSKSIQRLQDLEALIASRVNSLPLTFRRELLEGLPKCLLIFFQDQKNELGNTQVTKVDDSSES